MEIKIFGRGCSRCATLAQTIEREVERLGISADIIKINDEVEIVKNGIMSVPAIMINGKTVHAGGVPSTDEIRSWLERYSKE